MIISKKKAYISITEWSTKMCTCCADSIASGATCVRIDVLFFSHGTFLVNASVMYHFAVVFYVYLVYACTLGWCAITLFEFG